jgi:hypothetical protein
MKPTKYLIFQSHNFKFKFSDIFKWLVGLDRLVQIHMTSTSRARMQQVQPQRPQTEREQTEREQTEREYTE